MIVSVRLARTRQRAAEAPSTSPVSNSSVPSSNRTASTAPVPTSSPRERAAVAAGAQRASLRGRSLISCRIAAVCALGDQVAVHEHQHRGAIRSTSCSTCDETITVRPSSPEPVQQLDHCAALCRVEAVQRLVQQQQVGLVGERLGELHALAHAVREPAHLALGDVGEVDRLERPARRGNADRATLCSRAHSSTTSRAVRNGHGGLWSGTMPTRR